MPKPPNKSSASAGTRKKQAAKKAEKSGGNQAQASGKKQLTKAEKKALKNAPKQKSFVPPPKPPAPAIPDPLDSQGLARTLPAELVVVLRRLGKKDPVTRRKGLEELKEGWIDALLGKNSNRDSNEAEDVLFEALPVWVSCTTRPTVWTSADTAFVSTATQFAVPSSVARPSIAGLDRSHIVTIKLHHIFVHIELSRIELVLQRTSMSRCHINMAHSLYRGERSTDSKRNVPTRKV